jgi:branched-chain amino acid transport system substrate-binding protein
MMKFPPLAISTVVFAAGLATVLPAPSVLAQSTEQFFPALVFRTGAYAPNGAPWADGYVDYLKLTNARGGINGVKVSFEECETAYATDRGVECYERLKGKNGGATVFQPLSTGITFALTEKAPIDKIPLITAGYGLSEAADGGVFGWNFPITGVHWASADMQVQYIAQREGGFDRLKGKKITLLYHDSPYGKEAIPVLEARAAMHGFTFNAIPVTHPGVEQKSAWLQIRQNRPDYVLLWGWGVMNPTALKEAQATGFSREKVVGHWPSGGEPDIGDLGASAKGYSAVVLQPAAAQGSKVVEEILSKIYAKGEGTGPKESVGQMLYMRGVVSAMIGVEGVRRAQERFGKSKVMSGEQVRWGLENLALDQPALDALGFADVLRPIHTSCVDHMGGAWGRVQTWDGTQWVPSGTWFEADAQLLKPMIRKGADKYAASKKIERRSPQSCQD